MVSAIRHDKLKLKINSLEQMVMNDTKKRSLICDKPKSRSDVKSPSQKTKDGITCCQVRVKEHLRRHWLMNIEQCRNYNGHEKTEEIGRTCSSATLSPWIWSHPGLNMSLCDKKPVSACLSYCRGQWICLLQNTEGEAIKHKTLTETFRLITLNFSCAAASSAFAWYKAWRLGSTSQ